MIINGSIGGLKIMANPRKFKEKIALVKQKEVEGTAEFEKIMKEVSDVKSKVDDASTSSRSPSGSAPPYRESRGRSMGGGPMRRPSERKVDTSPYGGGNNVYLSPPNDSTWRRASSDSAIHQSLSLQEKNITSRNFENTNQKRYAQPMSQHHGTNEHMNFSSFEPSLVCSNQLNSSYAAATDQLSASMANTGSLPDLTSIHFPGILTTAIRKESETSSSPFSLSPVTSPTTLSPIPMPPRNPYSRAHSPSDSNIYRPKNFGDHNIQQANQMAKSHAAQTGPASHLSSTNLPGLVNMHQNKDGGISIYNTVHRSQDQLSSTVMNPTTYMSEYGRPSSDMYNQGKKENLSSPCSMMSATKISHSDDRSLNDRKEGCNINQSFQNHFEHISLVDSNTAEQISDIPSSQDILNSIQFDGNAFVQFESNATDHYGANSTQSYNSMINNTGKINNMSVPRNGNYSNTKRNTSCNMTISLQETNCPSTNLPTKIPEIVFSDFSNVNQDFSKEIFGCLDLELGSIDVAGLQMLSDPNSPMITDPMIEDGFRRDLN